MPIKLISFVHKMQIDAINDVQWHYDFYSVCIWTRPSGCTHLSHYRTVLFFCLALLFQLKGFKEQ